MEFGTSTRTRKKLGACLSTCSSKHAVCTERWADVHRHALNPDALDERAQAAEPSLAPPASTEASTAATTEAPSDAKTTEAMAPLPPVEQVEGIILPTDEQLRGGAKPKQKAAPEPAAAPSSPVSGLPEGYEGLTVAQIKEAAPSWDADALAAALAYEQAHGKRKGALAALEAATAEEES